MAGISYFLGIDGGGTGSRSVLVDRNGNELARAEGGAANVATDMSEACDNLLVLTQRTFAAAGLADAQIEATYAVLGLAGSNVTASNAPVEAALPCRHVYVTDDREIVISGALGDGDGGIAAPGTGSFFACRKDGITRSLGGWGFILGDEASGARMGRRLLTRTIHAHDGIYPHSDLTRQILDKFDGDPSKMVQFANAADDGGPATPGDFGQFAREIVAAAKAGDVVGKELMQEGADWIELALSTLGYEAGMRMCLWGGLGQEYLPYLPTDMAQAVVPPDSGAVTGAVVVARKRLATLEG